MKTALEHILPSCSQVLLVAPPAMKHGEWVPDEHLITASRELAEGCRELAQKLGIRFADAGKWNVKDKTVAPPALPFIGCRITLSLPERKPVIVCPILT